ncbi:MAG TPA: TauD/TfdA family dioxygenase [Streptosporangiaceae bacterium]|nr:TauD/TfdA family dioxygenase [Streptosporangiaceae bacterium]
MAASVSPAVAAAALSSDFSVGDVADPLTLGRLRRQVCSAGLAVFDGAPDAGAMLAVAGQVMSVTAHPDSDKRGITTITDLGPAAGQPNAGGFSRRELMSHTDRSGVPDPPALMMLTCAVQAPAGGATRLTDGLAVHDDLRATCPESLHALSRARTVLFGGAAGYLGAVFTPAAGRSPARVAMRLRLDDLGFFSPNVAEWIPPLTASIERHTCTMTLHPGQGLLLDNHRWLHARDTFEGPRRLYRLLGNPLPGLGMYPGIPVPADQPQTPKTGVPGHSPARRVAAGAGRRGI